MMRRGLVLLALPWILLGCSASSHGLTASQKIAIKCAESWRKQGFNFDPNSMTPSQMFEKVQDIRRAAYWAKQGYRFDPNLMSSKEMDQKVTDIQRAEHWKQEHGYTFDANSLTAGEMDQTAKEVEITAYWERQGYYYDPKSEKVFLDKTTRTELGTLTSIHDGGSVIPPASSDRISAQNHTGAIGDAATWQVAETTHIDGWVKKVRRGTIFKTESSSFYEVTEPISMSAMELRPEVTVLTDGQKYKLLIEGLEENPICDKLAKGSIPVFPDSRVITSQIAAGSDGRTFAGFNHGNLYRLDNDQVWEQTEFYIHHYISVRPNVVIWNNGVTDMMKVEGIDKAVTVRRLN